MTHRPSLAIIGGGPAGLTLGVLLHKQRIPFTIYDLRREPTDNQLTGSSGMLDLHPESGIAAIKECGLYGEFLPLTGECSQEFVVANRNGDILHTVKGEGARPEISRNNLTKLLLSNIPNDCIKWDHKLLSARKPAAPLNSSTELDFGNHGKHMADLVVGADGAWSAVRQLLTRTRPHYSGMQNITVTIRNITQNYPHLASLVGTGSFSALGNRHAVVSQRGPGDSSRIYLWLTVPHKETATASVLAASSAASAKERLLGDDTLLGTFGAPIKELVATACDNETADNPGTTLDIKALYTLPHGSSWEHQHGTTLIGDAAHLMLPNGEGVNSAMYDALLLSRAISQACGSADNKRVSFQDALEPLLLDFEIGLVERAKEMGVDTDQLIGSMFGTDDAAYETAAFLKSMGEQQ